MNLKSTTSFFVRYFFLHTEFHVIFSDLALDYYKVDNPLEKWLIEHNENYILQIQLFIKWIVNGDIPADISLSSKP